MAGGHSGVVDVVLEALVVVEVWRHGSEFRVEG